MALAVVAALSSSLYGATTYTFQEGVNGYAGTKDTHIRFGSPDQDDGALDSLNPDQSDGGGQVHGLMRFDNIFGTAAGQIPAGSTVLQASLTIYLVNPGNSPSLHRLLKTWDESMTWNLWDAVNSDGVTADDIEAVVTADATFDVPAGTPYFKTIDLPAKTIQDWLDGKIPNYGWGFVPNGTDGIDFDSSEGAVPAQRPMLTVVAGAAGEAFIKLFSFTPASFSIQVEDGTLIGGQRVPINASSISLTLDGTKVTPASVTKGTNSITTITYAPATHFAPGSEHKVNLSFADTASTPKTFTSEHPITVAQFPVIPSSFAVTGVDTSKPGFKARVHQISGPRPGSGDINTIGIAEKQLANLLIDPGTSAPFANEADLTLAKNGIFELPGVINWNETAPAAAGNFTETSTPPMADALIPGVPGINGGVDHIAAELTTFLDLKTGFYRFGVNSDDGFRVTVGPSPHDVFATTLGYFDGGRGSSDTLFDFAVEKDGSYPVRLTWWEGTGGANLEFFLVDLATNQKILINDIANAKSVKAFRDGPNVFGQSREGTKTLIAIDDKQMWRYDDTGSDLGKAWREKSFNDSAWPQGPALLGYETNPADIIRTELTGRVVTFYFRARFNFDGDPAATQLRMVHVIDDGAIFYLNGVEIHRYSVPPGDIAFNVNGNGHENQHEMFTALSGGQQFVIPTTSLVKGENVLAVEVHNDGAGSSDAIMGVELYAAPAAVVAPPPSNVATLDVRVAGGLDDAEEHLTEANAIDITSSDLELGTEGGGADTQAIGIRFRNINIPAGSTITSAAIQFTVDESDDEPTSVLIHGELSANPIEYSTVAGDITRRTKTAASVAWNNIPIWNDASIGSAGPDQRTPDLSTIVRELIGQPGWTANNSMAFIITANPGGERTAEAFDGDAAAAPLLRIEYIAPSGSTRPTLSLARTATGLTLTFGGTLQSADSVTGPWTDVAAAVSPLSVTITGTQKFYRAKQ
jgi:hypothetical protein